jgi:signal transduction histidine kinase
MGPAPLAGVATIPHVSSDSRGPVEAVASSIVRCSDDAVDEILTSLTNSLGGTAALALGPVGTERAGVVARVGSDDEGEAAQVQIARSVSEGDGVVVLCDDDALVPGSGRACAVGAPITIQGRSAGAVVVVGAEQIRRDEVALDAVRLAVDRIGLALENAELRSSLERAMAQILERDERMLGRIGLDIHDGPTQQLSVALLEVQLLEAELAEADRRGAELPEALRPAMGRIYETVGGALHEMRELIGHLRPAQFEDRTLPEILGDAITAFEARSGAQVDSAFSGEFPRNGISITQRITFYRVLQEALANAHRHGAARSCAVEVLEDERGIRLTVHDDGSGFDVDQALRSRAGAPMARFGLHGIRDRAELLGGTFEVESVVGEGSHLSVFLPRWEQPAGGAHGH